MNKFYLPKGKEEYYFVLALGIILVIIVILIGIISLTQTTPPVTNKEATLPTPTLAATNNIPSQGVYTNPPVTYTRDASVKLIQKEEQRTPLTDSDMQAKNNILKLLPEGQDYGTVYSSNNINIYYVQSLDLFKVEVLTINVASAKTEAENWFTNQGMSQEGVCNLPLGFYLNWDTANILRDSGFEFNPLPDGC